MFARYFIRQNKRFRAGYTYPEVLLALVIVSLVGGTLYQYAAFAMKNNASLQEHIFLNINLIQTERSLRNDFKRVSVPFWADPRNSLEIGPVQAKVPWFDGEKDKTLTVSVVEGGHRLLVTAGPVSRLYDFGKAALELQPALEGDNVIGLIITVDATVYRRSVYRLIFYPESFPVL